MKSDTVIRLGTVLRTDDIFQSGKMVVSIEEAIEQGVEVVYTSPYGAGATAGFVAIPERGAKVLICKQLADQDRYDHESGKWYYLSTVFDITDEDSGVNADKLIKEEGGVLPRGEEIYSHQKSPQKYIFQSPRGNRLVLSDSGNEKFMDFKTELATGKGKKLSLIDSPEIDSIIIKNEFGDRVKISSKDRHIFIETLGAIKIMSRESSIEMKVIDGREINIENMSSGKNKISTEDGTFGNINIVSDEGDISILTHGESGSVFLETEGSSSFIDLKSKNNIVISAENTVQINADVVDINGQSNVDVDGGRIDLN